jgi:hypothetical protein
VGRMLVWKGVSHGEFPRKVSPDKRPAALAVPYV